MLDRQQIYNKLVKEVKFYWCHPEPITEEALNREANKHAVQNTDKEFYNQVKPFETNTTINTENTMNPDTERVITIEEELEQMISQLTRELMISTEKLDMRDFQINDLVTRQGASGKELRATRQELDNLQDDIAKYQDYDEIIADLHRQVELLTHDLAYAYSLSKSDCNKYKQELKYLERTLHFAEVAVGLSEEAVEQSTGLTQHALAKLTAIEISSEITKAALDACEKALSESYMLNEKLEQEIWELTNRPHPNEAVYRNKGE